MITKDEWGKLKTDEKLDYLMKLIQKLINASENATRIGDNVDQSITSTRTQLKKISDDVVALQGRVKKIEERK